METDRFDILYVIGLSVAVGASAWSVYSNYRRCIRHLAERDAPVAVSRDAANITLDAMVSTGLAVVLGIGLGSLPRELRWLEVSLLVAVFGLALMLSVPVLRQLVRRRPGQSSDLLTRIATRD